MATLKVFSLDLNCSIKAFSCCCKALWTAFAVSLACCFEFASKFCANVESALIKGPFESYGLAAFRVGNADIAACLAGHFKARTCQLFDHIRPIFDLSALRQGEQPVVDLLGHSQPVTGHVAWLGERLAPCWVVRVCKAMLDALHCRPRIHAAAVRGVVVRL
jgi:hypothetical protein